VFAPSNTYVRDGFPDLPDEAWPAVLAELSRVLRCEVTPMSFVTGALTGFLSRQHATPDLACTSPSSGTRTGWARARAAWRSGYEPVLFLGKGHRARNPNNLGNVFRHRATHLGYPTEKPVALLRTLIDRSSAPVEPVLDPFRGSGNVGGSRRASLAAGACSATSLRALARGDYVTLPWSWRAPQRDVIPGPAAASPNDTAGRPRSPGTARSGRCAGARVCT